jgi:large subunit ribosomal protein L24
MPRRKQPQVKRAPMRVRRDDTVMIIGGKDKGKTGKVVRTDPKRQKVYVENLNLVKRHQRPTSVKETQKGSQVGGIVDKEGPIHISNVMVVDPSNNKPTRLRVERSADGKRKRKSVRTGTDID